MDYVEYEKHKDVIAREAAEAEEGGLVEKYDDPTVKEWAKLDKKILDNEFWVKEMIRDFKYNAPPNGEWDKGEI